MRWLDSIIYSMDMNLSKLLERVKDRKPGVLQSMVLQRVRHDLATEQNVIWYISRMISRNFSILLRVGRGSRTPNRGGKVFDIIGQEQPKSCQHLGLSQCSVRSRLIPLISPMIIQFSLSSNLRR